MTDRNRTAVILSYRKNRRNYRLLFGRPEAEIRRGWHRKLAIFPPNKVVGYERWEANSYGTQRWTIRVCRTVSSGSITQIPGIRPGAKLLLQVQGATKSKRFLDCLDRLKAQNIDLEKVSDRHWMELSLRFDAGAKVDKVLAIFEEQASC
jgi:hypothetical protein